MSRAAATVVILAWNAWAATDACLKGLRKTVGPDDQVIVVDNGSTDRTQLCLREHPWVEVLTNTENRGFPAGANQAAAAARNPLLVFLHNDTLLSPNWLDGLLAAFDVPTVVAAGPRSNSAYGQQLIDAPYEVADRAGTDDFAWLWRLNHASGRTTTRRLDGFCLAVRADSFQAVGGFDEAFGLGGGEDDDLSLRLVARGGRLVIVDDVFVHHEGRVSFDANGIDWFALRDRNAAFLHDRHAGAPALPWPHALPAREPAGDEPLVSVLLDAGERVEPFRRALDSVRSSTLRPVEVLVCSNGPDLRPDLAEVVGEHDGQLAVRIVPYGPHSDVALLAARGRYVAFLDAGSMFLPHHLQSCVDVLEAEGPGIGVHAYGIRVVEDEMGEVVSREVVDDRPASPEQMRVRNLLDVCAPVVRADDVRAVGGFDARLPRLRDWELWLRLQSRIAWRFLPLPGVQRHVPRNEIETVTRHWFDLRNSLLFVYAQHPVIEGSPTALQRAHRASRPAAWTGADAPMQFVGSRVSSAAETSYDVSVVITGSGDVPGLVRTLQSAASVLTGGKWQLLLCLPKPQQYMSLLQRLDGDLQVYEVGNASREEVWDFAAGCGTGKHVLLVDEGEILDSLLVLSAFKAPSGEATRVGVHTAAPIPIPRLAVAGRS